MYKIGRKKSLNLFNQNDWTSLGETKAVFILCMVKASTILTIFSNYTCIIYRYWFSENELFHWSVCNWTVQLLFFFFASLFGFVGSGLHCTIKTLLYYERRENFWIFWNCYGVRINIFVYWDIVISRICFRATIEGPMSTLIEGLDIIFYIF